MPSFDDLPKCLDEMPQHELIELLKAVAAEVVDRETNACLSDDGWKLANEIVEHVNNYDSYVDNRPLM